MWCWEPENVDAPIPAATHGGYPALAPMPQLGGCWDGCPLPWDRHRPGGRTGLGGGCGAWFCPSHLQSLNLGGCWVYNPASATKVYPQSHRSELGLLHLWWPRDLGWGDSGAPLSPLSPSFPQGTWLPVTRLGGWVAGAARGDGGSTALVMNPSPRSSHPTQILDFPEGGRSALTSRRLGSARRGRRLGLIRGHWLKGSHSCCPWPLRLF